MPIKVNEIGLINRQLVLDLARGNSSTSRFPIQEFRHDQNYNYDLSYEPLHKALKGSWVGEKYYCYKSMQEIDMQKRIVQVYDAKDRRRTQKSYRLIHKAGNPGAYDNTYDRIDEITGITEEPKAEADAIFQAEATALGGIDISIRPPALDKSLRTSLWHAAGRIAGNRVG